MYSPSGTLLNPAGTEVGVLVISSDAGVIVTYTAVCNGASKDGVKDGVNELMGVIKRELFISHDETIAINKIKIVKERIIFFIMKPKHYGNKFEFGKSFEEVKESTSMDA